MNKDTLLDKLDYLTDGSKDSLNKQILFLTLADYNFKLDPEPESILFRLNENVRDYKSALIVAKTFKHLYGNIIICRDYSKHLNKIITIIDCLELFRNLKPSPYNDYIYEAFINVFDRYRAPRSILLELYHLDDNYVDHIPPVYNKH